MRPPSETYFISIAVTSGKKLTDGNQDKYVSVALAGLYVFPYLYSFPNK